MKTVYAEFRTLDWASDRATCDSCGKSCTKLWDATRNVVDCSHEGYSLLRVIVGVYSCMICGFHFRAQPPFLSPRSRYTNKVVNIAISSVIEDGMPISKVPHRLHRDFGIMPSESTVRNWIADAGFKLQEDAVIDFKSIEEFSGVLCIDEGYSGNLSLLLAADPKDKGKILGYVVNNGSFCKSDVENFLKNLNEIGVKPEQVITDQSPLYPKVVKEIWPQAKHQLCLFHVCQKLTKASRKAVRALKATLPKPKKENFRSRGICGDRASLVRASFELRKSGVPIREISRRTGVSRNSLKKWFGSHDFVRSRYGIEVESIEANSRGDYNIDPSKSKNVAPEPWSSWEEIKNTDIALGKLAYKISTRDSNTLTSNEFWIEATKSPIGKTLQEIRSTIDLWNNIWYQADGSKIEDREICRRNWELLRQTTLSSEVKHLKSFISKMTDELFDSVTTQVGVEKFEATNNGAERQMRSFKKIQKLHYRIRSRKSFARIFALKQAMHRDPITNDELEVSKIVARRAAPLHQR